MDRPRLYIDLNEALEPDLFLLSQGDTKPDSAGGSVHLEEGLRVYVYNDDGEPDPFVAAGTVERNTAGGWSSAARWCCRIDEDGIRHLSELSP